MLCESRSEVLEEWLHEVSFPARRHAPRYLELSVLVIEVCTRLEQGQRQVKELLSEGLEELGEVVAEEAVGNVLALAHFELPC